MVWIGETDRFKKLDLSSSLQVCQCAKLGLFLSRVTRIFLFFKSIDVSA